MQEDLNQRVLDVEQALRGLDLQETITVLAFVLTREGLSYMDPEHHTGSNQEIGQNILKHHAQHGQTIEGAVAMQGLSMLEWLDGEK